MPCACLHVNSQRIPQWWWFVAVYVFFFFLLFLKEKVRASPAFPAGGRGGEGGQASEMSLCFRFAVIARGRMISPHFRL